MTLTQQDVALTSELDDALVPLDVVARAYRVTDRTLRRWLDTDNVTRHPYNGGKAVRWGDIPKPSANTTRWARPAPDVSGRSGNL